MLVTKLVSTETDVFRRLVDSAVDSKTALLEPQKTSVSSRGFQAGFHGIMHLLDWLQGMVTGKVTADPWFSGWLTRQRLTGGVNTGTAVLGRLPKGRLPRGVTTQTKAF